MSKTKTEASLLQARRHRTLATEQQHRQLTQQHAQSKRRGRHKGRAMQLAAQGLAEGAVTLRRRRAGIIRTARRVLLQEKINQGDLVAEMNPRHPLPAIAERATQAKLERQQQAL